MILANGLLGLVLALGMDEPIKASPRPTPRLGVDDLRPAHFFYRPDPYWRARLSTPNRFGEYRPRVIHGPDGAYWPLDGTPYYFTPIRGIQ